jgi:GDPmannose 4,6-dehydratase
VTSHPVLVVGHRGQDGTLLRRSLAHQGIPAVGVGRDVVEEYAPDGTLRSSTARAGGYDSLVQSFKPREIYYFAAEHSSSEGNRDALGSLQDFDRVFASSVRDWAQLLDAVERHGLTSRVFFASSARVFEETSLQVVDESAPFHPRSLYSMAKAQSVWIARKYREERGIFVVTGTLFNHESHLRGPTFLSSRIVSAAIRAAAGDRFELVLRNLSAEVDWGYAPDFVNAFQRAVRHSSPEDYVIATAKRNSVRDFARLAFEAVGLDSQDYVVESPAPEVGGGLPRADISKIRSLTGWVPNDSFESLVRQLVTDFESHTARERP